MKKISLMLFLLLSVCAAEPAFAHPDPKPIRWYAVFVWHEPTGIDWIEPMSVRRAGQPQWAETKQACITRTMNAVKRNKDNFNSDSRYPPVLSVYCIAARNKLELRNFLRTMNFNFGGRPA